MDGTVRVATILCGYAVGVLLGGTLGLVAGGAVALLGVILVDELAFRPRTRSGLWLRNRGALLRWALLTEMAVVLDAGSARVWAAAVGMGVAYAVGRWVERALGWSYHRLAARQAMIRSYVGALASAANADGPPSDGKKSWVRSFVGEKFGGPGAKADADVEGFLQSSLIAPPTAAEAGAACARFAWRVAHFLHRDLCSVLFSSGDLNPAEADWLVQFQKAAGWNDWDPGEIFRRTQATATGNGARDHSGLGRAGTDGQDGPDGGTAAAGVLSASRPDRSRPKPLFFRGADDQLFTPGPADPFDCKCWLCGQACHGDGGPESRAVRCPKCFALAGLEFDPSLPGNGLGTGSIGAEADRMYGSAHGANPEYATIAALAIGLLGSLLSGLGTPYDYDRLMGVGETQFQKQNYPAAIEAYSGALKHKPDGDEAYRMRGHSWLRRGEYDIAVKDFEEAIRIAPGNATYRLDVATALAAKGENAAAIRHLDQALVASPQSANALKMRARLRHAGGDLDKALHDVNEVLRANPGDPEAFPLRSEIWLSGKNYPSAIADLREAIRLKPAEPKNYRALAWLLASCPDPQLRNGREAVALAKTGLEKAGRDLNHDYHGVKAAAHAEAGEFDAAVAEQLAAIDMLKAGPKADPKRIAEYEGVLQFYREKKPLHQSP
jgi:Flp pilus assembly protein TadD